LKTIEIFFYFREINKEKMLHFLTRLKEEKRTTEELDYVIYSQQKRIGIFSQLCTIGIVAVLAQAINDFYLGFPFVSIIDVFIAIILFLSYYLNKHGKNHLAKIFLFTSINIILFCFAAVVPQGVGIYLIYFPLVIFYFISFDFENRSYAFSFTVLSLTFEIILLATNYQPFGQINIQPVDPFTSFSINLIMSIILISLAINYLIRMNHIGEGLLLNQKNKSDRLSKEIQEKNLALEKTNKELDQFVYSTSHDLKAPLTSIKGLLDLAEMEKEPIPPFFATYLKMMRERVDSLNIFIEDILEYSRNSRLDIVLKTVNISELIDEVFITNKYLGNSDKVKLEANVDSSLTVKIDKNRIFRVLVNLVSNAIKYSDLSKEKPIITVSAVIESKKIVLTVNDNGIGISQENSESVFDMFYRGTELADGSGLGLYIAREMMLKMNGTLEFESELNKGSTFTIKIPLA